MLKRTRENACRCVCAVLWQCVIHLGGCEKEDRCQSNPVGIFPLCCNRTAMKTSWGETNRSLLTSGNKVLQLIHVNSFKSIYRPDSCWHLTCLAVHIYQNPKELRKSFESRLEVCIHGEWAASPAHWNRLAPLAHPHPPDRVGVWLPQTICSLPSGTNTFILLPRALSAWQEACFTMLATPCYNYTADIFLWLTHFIQALLFFNGIIVTRLVALWQWPGFSPIMVNCYLLVQQGLARDLLA